ncbi:MAG: serine/threonine protein kinase [Planctomycetes bacterium]|nr:serine/threonine protein kinase [Planctomycetota bacterium]
MNSRNTHFSPDESGRAGGVPRKPATSSYPVHKPETRITRRPDADDTSRRKPGTDRVEDKPHELSTEELVGGNTEVQGNVVPVEGGPNVEYRAENNPQLADTQPMDPAEIEPPPPVAGESPRVSFGQAAMNLGLVNAAQIQECVNIQRAQMSKGQRVALLGQILLERGYLERSAIDKIKSYQQVHQFSQKIPGYQIVEQLGRGAMGTVFKAKQTRMERWVAIKILQPELAANPGIKARFLQEARASAKLNHPNIITGIDAGEAGGLSYFCMEYVEGKTLQQLVRERGPMDEKLALEVILQVAKALEHAEKHGLVHRDIKPDNIMVTRERIAKLLDLGLAKVRAADESTSTKGMAVGTPNYISPEQAMGRQDIDTRSDIYSLGVTLFYMLTSRVPYEGPPEVVMYRHIHEPPPHPKNLRPDLSDSASTLIFNMMAKRPEDRPASAGHLVSDIEHIIKTGKLPGLFQTPPPAGGMKLSKGTSGMLVPQKKRMANLRGYGMPQGQSQRQAAAPQPTPPAAKPVPPPAPSARAPAKPAPAPQQPPPEEESDSVRMPRKRKYRFGGSW